MYDLAAVDDREEVGGQFQQLADVVGNYLHEELEDRCYLLLFCISGNPVSSGGAGI